jgi:carboxyl-terminal processing protease
MNKTFRKITFCSLIGIASLSSFAFVSGYFEVSKNLDIFTTLFREVNIYYVDETKPGEMI